MGRLPDFTARTEWFETHYPDLAAVLPHMHDPSHAGWRMLSIAPPDHLRRILARVLDPEEFLSDHGIRSLSRYHLDHPLDVDLGGAMASLNYEPAESTSGLFGGNSNWRGPVWMPVNYLLVEVLRVYHRYLGSDFTVEFPTGSGRSHDLSEVADELSRRGSWHDLIPFHEYFNGDTGAGLGASHQTGWTGLVADLIIRRYGTQARAAGGSRPEVGPPGEEE